MFLPQTPFFHNLSSFPILSFVFVACLCLPNNRYEATCAFGNFIVFYLPIVEASMCRLPFFSIEIVMSFRHWWILFSLPGTSHTGRSRTPPHCCQLGTARYCSEQRHGVVSPEFSWSCRQALKKTWCGLVVTTCNGSPSFVRRLLNQSIGQCTAMQESHVINARHCKQQSQSIAAGS